MRTISPIGHLYVHVPFCRTRCAYCDFASEPVGPHARAGRTERYVQRLLEELREWARDADAEPGRGVETVYMGGGTPTVLPEGLLLPLVATLAELQEGVAGREFTIEANPGTIDAELLAGLLEAGVTRVSLGVQSFSPRLRDSLGRRTGQAEVEAALRDVREAASGPKPLREWNIDLVFGIPGQDWVAAAADLDAAIAAGPTHISLYDLTYTARYAARIRRTAGAGAPSAAGAFTEEYLSAAAARLEAGGYLRYEVSNFALPGHECRHNQAYWRGGDYVGIGASAVSTVGSERLTNPAEVAGYLRGRPAEVELLSPRARLWERAMLGLRTAQGVVEDDVRPALDIPAVERLVGQDCLRRACGRLRLNPAFLDVSNTVISTALAAPERS